MPTGDTRLETEVEPVTLHFGPKMPGAAGDDESNWVPTSADRLFEVLFRLYGPDKSFFDKSSWKLPDIEGTNWVSPDP